MRQKTSEKNQISTSSRDSRGMHLRTEVQNTLNENYHTSPRVAKRVSAAERASEASGMQQANG